MPWVVRHSMAVYARAALRRSYCHLRLWVYPFWWWESEDPVAEPSIKWYSLEHKYAYDRATPLLSWLNPYAPEGRPQTHSQS